MPSAMGAHTGQTAMDSPGRRLLLPGPQSYCCPFHCSPTDHCPYYPISHSQNSTNGPKEHYSNKKLSSAGNECRRAWGGGHRPHCRAEGDFPRAVPVRWAWDAAVRVPRDYEAVHQFKVQMPKDSSAAYQTLPHVASVHEQICETEFS